MSLSCQYVQYSRRRESRHKDCDPATRVKIRSGGKHGHAMPLCRARTEANGGILFVRAGSTSELNSATLLWWIETLFTPYPSGHAPDINIVKHEFKFVCAGFGILLTGMCVYNDILFLPLGRMVARYQPRPCPYTYFFT